MGRFDFQIPVEFLKQLGRLADVEKYAPQMLEAAVPILVRSVKASLTLSAYKNPTGKMVASVKASRLFHNNNGFWMTVRPTGVDQGVRNMEKAAYLEYGTSKQPARPWADRASNNAKEEVLDAMQKAFEEAVK